MKRLQKYQSLPKFLIYRLEIEIGLICLTKYEKVMVYMYLILIIHSFFKSTWLICKCCKNTFFK